MLKKPQNYESIEVKEYGDYEAFKLGGHRCIIKSAEEYESIATGNVSLKICVDADKGDEQEGYFQKQFDNNTNQDKKWPTGATKYVSLRDDENCVRMLKAFITAVENSNPNYKYDWNKDVNQLIGKKIAGNWGLEEYRDGEGNLKVATKLRDFRSIDKVESLKVPKVKLEDGKTYADYETYQMPSVTQTADPTAVFDNVEITEDDLPFDL